MYKRILVPVDDSQTSELALAEASKLAKGLGSELRLVHVIDLTQLSWGDNEFLDVSALQGSIKETGKQILALAVQKIQEAEIEFSATLLESWGDKIPYLVNEEAAECGADLIVMGTHGWSGVMHLLMGSVAEGVVRSSDIPVLLVRAGGRSERY